MLIQQTLSKMLMDIRGVSDQELFDHAVGQFMKDRPSGYTSAGSYDRMMITVIDGQRREIFITVPRVRFKDPATGRTRTHALLTDNLIPFGSYTIRFVLHVLHASLHRDGSLSGFCALWGISTSTLRDWKRLFIAHYSSWMKKISAIKGLCNEMLESIERTISFPHLFFTTFRVSFLQSRYRCFDLLSPVSHPSDLPVP